MNIHDCTACVRGHFYRADHLQLLYTLPLEAYQLNRQLQYRLCQAWNRFENRKEELTPRECILLAEAWCMAAPEYVNVMHVDSAWRPSCARCGKKRLAHDSHPENTPQNSPPDRWVCQDGGLYTPIEYKLPASHLHPKEVWSER